MSDSSTPAAPLYGGQAVIEGVMMRGPQHFAVACRRANGGIEITSEPVPKILRPNWQKWPFLRGIFALVDSLTLGIRALFWAAKIAEADLPQGETDKKSKKKSKGLSEAERLAREEIGAMPASGAAVPGIVAVDTAAVRPASRVTDIVIKGALFSSLLIGIGLFKVLPTLITEWVKHEQWVPPGWKLGLIDAAVRYTIFFAYIGFVSRLLYVRRVFQYHGAEHKAINALEAHGTAGLTVEHAIAASRLHPRCGTSFIGIVLLMSVLANSPFYALGLLWRLPISIAMLFPVAGVSFELLRLAGKYRDNPIAAALSRPGMWMQLLTTREPDASQVEVALASLKAAMDAEEEMKTPNEPILPSASDDLAEDIA